MHAHNTALAWEFMPRIDAALCVLNADQPFTASEREFFLAAAERAPRLLVAVNKIDHLGEHERAHAIEFIQAVSAQLITTSEVEFYPVSAKHGEGMPLLRERIRRLAEDEAGTLVIASVARLAAGAADGAAQALRFEAHAIELPLDELRRRALLFGTRVDDLGEARSQADDLLQAGVRRLLDQRVNAPLMSFARDRADALSAALSAQAAALGRLPARELGPALDAWIDEAIRERFGELVPRLEASIAAEVRELQRGFAARIEAILAEVQDAADEAFGSRAGGLLPEVDLSEPSAFTFKLADVAHMLDNVVAFGRRTMPGELGRRMVTRDAQERLLHMADRHAGRLRSALVERVRDAVRDYQRRAQRLRRGRDRRDPGDGPARLPAAGRRRARGHRTPSGARPSSGPAAVPPPRAHGTRRRPRRRTHRGQRTSGGRASHAACLTAGSRSDSSACSTVRSLVKTCARDVSEREAQIRVGVVDEGRQQCACFDSPQGSEGVDRRAPQARRSIASERAEQRVE